MIKHQCVRERECRIDPHRLWICQNQVPGAPAFNHRGIDFAGPVYFKGPSGMKKAYICLFTCATSRALHLELTPDLSMEAFIRCQKRFTGQCGRPISIMTDNAKTFKRANKELGQLLKIKRTQVVKRSLQKVLGKVQLSYEELETVLIEPCNILV